MFKPTSNLFLQFALALVLAVGLTSCASSELYEQTQTNVFATEANIDTAKKDQMAPLPAVISKPEAYVDTTPVSLKRPPAWLNKKISVHGDDLPFGFYVAKIMDGTGVSIHYQSGLDERKLVSMSYRGTVKGALSELQSKSGYAFEAHKNNLTWRSLVTKTFNISFMPGTADYLIGRKAQSTTTQSISGGSGGTTIQQVSAQSTDDEYSNLTGQPSLWKDVTDTINGLLSADGKAVVSEATTSVTVTDHLENVRGVEGYLKDLNENLSRQVLLKVVVLDITLNNDFSYGINWDLIRSQWGKIFNFTGDFSNVATLNNTTFSTIGVMIPETSNKRMAGSDLMIEALNEQGQVSVVTRPEVVTLNNQVAEISITNQTAYLAAVSTTQSLSNASTSLTPGIVTDGFSMYVLPKIQDKKIYLQITSSLSALTGISEFTSGTDGLSIQTPSLAEKFFNQRTLIQSGETLVLAGFKQVRNQANSATNFDMEALGGKGSGQQNVETIILITPLVMAGQHHPHILSEDYVRDHTEEALE